MTNAPIRIDPDAFYTENALHFAGLSDSALARARRRGELRHTRRAGRTMYLGRWVIDWLTEECAEREVAACG